MLPTNRNFRGYDWPDARQKALERDNYLCQDCGTNTPHMEVHHLVSWHDTHDNSLENLISLCKPCHRTREAKGKTYEEIYGAEKAAELKEIRSKSRSFQSYYDRAKGSTYEEIYGEGKAIELKQMRREAILKWQKERMESHPS